MPKNDSVDMKPNVPVCLTAAAVAAMWMEIENDYPVQLQLSASPTVGPADTGTASWEVARTIYPGTILTASFLLDGLFPGGLPAYVWGRCTNVNRVRIGHA